MNKQAIREEFYEKFCYFVTEGMFTGGRFLNSNTIPADMVDWWLNKMSQREDEIVGMLERMKQTVNNKNDRDYVESFNTILTDAINRIKQ